MRCLEKVDLSKPYLFVSYASVDEVQVFSDVRKLQNEGINIWIDTELNRYAGKSWKSVVKNAIRNGNCKAVLLFVSKFALISKAVKYELDLTISSDVKGTHFGKKVPVIPIEVTPISDITEYCYQIANEYSMSNIEADILDEDDEENYRPSQNVNHIREIFFENNDRRYERLYDMDDKKPFMDGLKKYGISPNPIHTYITIDRAMADKAFEKAKKLYQEGNSKEAYDYFVLSAFGGLSRAYIWLGMICTKRNDVSTTTDLLQAESCWIRANDLGNLEAPYFLAGLYYNKREEDNGQMARKQIEKIKEMERHGRRTNDEGAREKYLKACRGLHLTE